MGKYRQGQLFGELKELHQKKINRDKIDGKKFIVEEFNKRKTPKDPITAGLADFICGTDKRDRNKVVKWLEDDNQYKLAEDLLNSGYSRVLILGMITRR